MLIILDNKIVQLLFKHGLAFLLEGFLRLLGAARENHGQSDCRIELVIRILIELLLARRQFLDEALLL